MVLNKNLIIKTRRCKRNKARWLILFAIVSVLGMIFISQESSDYFIVTREPQLTDEQKLAAMGSRYASEVVNPLESTVYINPEMFSFEKIKNKATILILVTSTPEAILRRDLIRKSWKKWTEENSDIHVYFFLGLPKSSPARFIYNLKQENEMHGDLIVDDFIEGYFRLTPKTLRMLKWFLQSYKESSSRPDFLVKTDHDVFINIPNLVNHLNSIFNSFNSLTNSASVRTKIDPYEMKSSYSIPWHYIGGQRYIDPLLDLDPNSKFYMSPKFWLNSTTPHYLLLLKNYFEIGESLFPTYVAGPCYILSGNVVEKIYEASFSVPLFPFEDVYLTGMVGWKHLNLSISNITGIETHIKKMFTILEDNKELRESMALHPMEPPELISSVYDQVLKLNYNN